MTSDPKSPAGRSADPARSGSALPVVIGLAVSGLLLALAVRNVRLAEVGRALSCVNVGWLPVMAAGVLVDILVRSLRWRLLLSEAAPRAGLWRVCELETIGLAVNNVAFLRVGEVVRGVLAAKEFDVPALTVLATIVVERLLDLMSLVALFAAAAGLYPAFVEPRLRFAALGLAGSVALAVLALARADGFIRDPAWEERLRGLPGIRRWLRQAALGARALRSAPTAAAVVALGFSLWMVDAGLYWVAGEAMGLEPHLTYGHSVLVLAAAAAASFLPAVPGSFGAFEQAVKLLLVRLGVGESAAFGFAALVHVPGYLVVTGLGIAFLYHAGHTLAGLKALGRGAAKETAA